MSSTFHGLETARRALNTQQAGLYTTGHNVANANTPGYTRQRINVQATEAYPPASMNRPMIPGQIGTGVSAGAVQRIRESFLDTQYRKENAKLGYYGTNADALAKLEDILNETRKDSSGISKVLNDFWQSLQDLSTNPENSGAREVVIERGHAVADTFNYIYGTIEDYRDDLWSQIDQETGKINSILESIDDLNKKIAELEPLGYLPNDLYDQRDLLVDELSTYFEIEVIPHKPEQMSDKKLAGMVEGTYEIKLKGSNDSIVDKDGFKKLSVKQHETDDDPPVIEEFVSSIIFGNPDDGGFTIKLLGDTDKLPQGRLKGLIENYGYAEEYEIGNNEKGIKGKGTYLSMLAELDDLATKLMDDVNAAHNVKDDDGNLIGRNLFKKNDAGRLEMELTDPELLEPAASRPIGDGSVALKVADSIKGVLKKYENITGKLGVDARFANGQKGNVGILRDTVEQKRLSVSTVSLDEEMMNMIKFQHAYNAAARNITVVDEMLDKIINGMGVVGR